MKHKKEFYNILNTLKELKDAHPNIDITKYIDTVYSDNNGIWGMSDKEFAFQLDKAAKTLDMEGSIITDDKSIDDIIEQGKNLFDINEDDEDGLWDY